jgi:hypothetical protein
MIKITKQSNGWFLYTNPTNVGKQTEWKQNMRLLASNFNTSV